MKMNMAIYASGLMSLSVCTAKHATREQIEDYVNLMSPTGIEAKWKISEDGHFADGSPMPNQCEEHSDRQHWLLHC